MICIEEESINLLDFFQLYFEKKSYVHMIEWAGRDWRDGTGQEGAGHGTGRDPQIRTKRDGTRKCGTWDGMGRPKRRPAELWYESTTTSLIFVKGVYVTMIVIYEEFRFHIQFQKDKYETIL